MAKKKTAPKRSTKAKSAAKPIPKPKATAKPKGRPSGSKNHEVGHAEGELTRCPKCGSTQRGPYGERRVQQYEGVDPAGKPYTAIVRRRTKCSDCGQHRIDRHFENAPAKKR